MVIILRVSLPSMGSRTREASRRLMPDSLAALLISSSMPEKVVRRSATYLPRNWSPWVRAFSTLSTRDLDLTSRSCNSCNWPRRATSWRRRSSAEPPKGLKAQMAAPRLAASNSPSTAREMTRGSRTCTPVRPSLDRLKLLGIVHTHPVAVQGLGLRRGQAAVEVGGAEQRRRFERLEQLDGRFRRFGPHVHVQGDLILCVDKGADGNHPDVVGEGLLEVGEDAGPTDAFAVEQGVEEDALFQDFGVIGAAQDGVEARLLGIVFLDLAVEAGDAAPGVPQQATVEQGEVHEHAQGRDQNHADGDGGDHHRPVAPEGLARQIDR